MMSAERKSAVITEENRKLTVDHEGGHALVTLYTDGARPNHKATILSPWAVVEDGDVAPEEGRAQPDVEAAC
jgi:ATP-dependent Zn protease